MKQWTKKIEQEEKKYVKQNYAKITRQLYIVFICSSYAQQSYSIFVLNCIFIL